MTNMLMVRLKNWAPVGALAGVIATLIGKYVFSQLPTIKVQFSAIDVNVGAQGLPMVGRGIADWLRFGDVNIIVAVISGIILAVAGRYLYQFLNIKLRLPHLFGNTKFGKTALVLMWGALVGRVIMAGFGIPFNSVGAWIAFLLYWAFVTAGVLFAMTLFKKWTPQ